MLSRYPKVTFVIPIYNSEHFLEDCFESIKKQDYPKNKIEIICPDGGYKDMGPQIAKKYGAKVVKNPKILAEPGFMLGAKRATGELIVYMGADNRLVEKEWIKKIIKPFDDKKIIGAYSWHRNSPNNSWVTKYINAFTDPINSFVLGDTANTRTFHFAYKTRKKNEGYEVYDFKKNDRPMLAFDQGFTARRSYKRPIDTEYDDVLPVLDMIKKGMELAFVKGSSNYHFTMEKGIPQFSKKMRWMIDNNIEGHAKYGLSSGRSRLTKYQRLKLYIWPVYAASIFLPLLHSVYGYIRDGREEWKYHSLISFVMVCLLLYEVIRVKVLRQKSLAGRY